jgi:hypothetical protein
MWLSFPEANGSGLLDAGAGVDGCADDDGGDFADGAGAEAVSVSAIPKGLA